ncbi:MAG TPA: phytanoyl-CoA dioxygenase family protein [Actinoplanes sp.]|nr:phytanoyl-CoA dioxygenase family protein [Actinoplanes sp.]
MKKLVEKFVRDGFVVLGNVFQENQLNEMGQAFARIEKKVTDAPENYATRYTARTGGADTWGVNHVFAEELYEPELASVFENPQIMDFIHSALGNQIRFWGGHALWAPRRVGYNLNWHRDFGEHDVFNSTGQSNHVQFNVCLLSDSCFRAVPGSHRRPLTTEEAHQQRSRGVAPLGGEVVAGCSPGDVLMMNAHVLHRGSCDVGSARQTLHLSVQPMDEPTGGQSSWKFMRKPGYLDTLPAGMRELMQNAIDWDDRNPLSLAETRKRMRTSREIGNQLADGNPASGGPEPA